VTYILEQPETVGRLLGEHARLTLTALAFATAAGVPLGWFASRHPRARATVMGILSVTYTIPSLALMILFIGPLGLGARNVVVALVIYSQILIVRNVIAGLQGVDPAILEAARGMGMTARQRALHVELPLAAPMIVAGVRVAAVVSIGIATVGAKFGAGGLGRLLFDGVQQNRYDKIVAGAIAVGALALAVNVALIGVERVVASGRPRFGKTLTSRRGVG
jgi:osmoprotectant transport system permease protein